MYQGSETEKIGTRTISSTGISVSVSVIVTDSVVEPGYVEVTTDWDVLRTDYYTTKTDYQPPPKQV